MQNFISWAKAFGSLQAISCKYNLIDPAQVRRCKNNCGKKVCLILACCVYGLVWFSVHALSQSVA